jgi:CRISP-associated protein Cas1
MTVLFVTRQRARLQRRYHQLIVSDQGRELAAFAIMELEDVLVYGNVTLTGPAATLLMDHGVHVSYFTVRGRWKGTLWSQSKGNALRVLAQTSIYNDPERSIEFVREIVRRKLRSQRDFLKRRRESICREVAAELEELHERCNSAVNSESLRGLEGRAARRYFESWREILVKSDFQGRKRRPPEDPINSMLSLCYSMLTKEAEGLLGAMDLVVTLGFLHEIRPGRSSLALDVIEPFRAVVDAFVIESWNKRAVTAEDFIDSDNGCRFKRGSLSTFLQRWNHYFKTEPSGRMALRKAAVSWRYGILARDVAGLDRGTIELVG